MKQLETDLLIIGGGAAGCYAALTLGKEALRVLIAEKADIRRSGCLAAGVNALNAYITPGKTPQDYVDYARWDAAEIVRGDLLLTMSQRLNTVTRRLEELGLVILKDEDGNYATRGDRNIKINGENIKPLLAGAVMAQPNVQVLGKVNITDYIVQDNKILGAVGFHTQEETAYVISAGAVLCATGGAAGLYRPNNPGFSRHKMWYCPFNTGAGYAMGIRAGAEMTTLEMRFIALRCKDTIAPTGTIAQGVGARQVNGRGEEYEQTYGLRTFERLLGTVQENREGRGPCYLHTGGISSEQDIDLQKAYLNMAPAQTLRWVETGRGPQEQDVEIEGTEPYVVGGHAASGYWVNTDRMTTIHGLFAAGDVAGGCPQKYVTGALAEGEIAARAIRDYLRAAGGRDREDAVRIGKPLLQQWMAYRNRKASLYSVEELEESMQAIMDRYAGGIGGGYRFNERQLTIAEKGVARLGDLSRELRGGDMRELLAIAELRERLTVCRSLIAHLRARKETRWRGFAENADYPEQDDKQFLRYVNSRLQDGRLRIIYRDLVREGERYEHSN